MSNQRSRKVKMGSSRRRLDKTATLAPDAPKTQTDSDYMTMEHTDSVQLNYSEHGNQLGSKHRNPRQHDFKEAISETLHETSKDVANTSEKFRSSFIQPTSTVEIEVHANQSRSVSKKTSEPEKEDMYGNNRTENLGMRVSNVFTGEQCKELSENRAVTQMRMLPDKSCQEIKPQMSKPANDNRTQEVSQGSGDEWHPIPHLPKQPFADDIPICSKSLSDSIIHKGEHGSDIRKENTNDLAVSISLGTITESQDYIFQSEGVCDDMQSSTKKEHEVEDNVNPLLKHSSPIQSIVCPLLIDAHNQEESQEAEQDQITNNPRIPESHDTAGNSVIIVERQPLLTIQDTFNPGNNQETIVQGHLEITKCDHKFDLGEPEHNITENTWRQVCESEGQASKDPWELIEDPAQQMGEVTPLNIGALQLEYSSASAEDENDHTLTGRSENICLNDGTFGNLTKQPIKDEKLMEPENNDCGDLCREKISNLDSTKEFKDGCNNDSNITEFNPQSEKAMPTSSIFTLSVSESIDRSLVEGCLSTNMTDSLATVSQHCPPFGEDQCKSKEINAPTSSKLQDNIAHVGAQTSTGLTQTEGITTMGLNEVYLENEDKNTVELQEVTDFQQNNKDTAVDCLRLEKDVCFKLTEVASNVSNINQEHDADLVKKSSRKKIGSTHRTYNWGKKGGVDHTREIVESDLSAELNMTSKSFEVELKVEMKGYSELLERGRLATFKDKGADCLFSIPPQSEIKERDSEAITDKEPNEKNTGENTNHPPTGSSLDDKDDRKEEESGEKCQIVEKMEVIKSLPERNNHEEDFCKAATDPHEKDYNRLPGADVSMLVQKSFSKEITPHSEDINSSILFVPVSDIGDNHDNMDTAGQHPPADLPNLDQISGPEYQWSLPNIKDDDKHILRRRKMGSSRWTKGTASGSKEANATQDQDMEKHSVKSEKISEEETKKQNSKDNEEGVEKVVTDDNEPSQIGDGAHRSISENISATQDIERMKLGSTHMTFRMTPIQKNIQEKPEVDSEVSDDGKIFKDELKIKQNQDNDTEQNGERSSETRRYPSVDTLIRNSEKKKTTDGKRVDSTLSSLPSELSKYLNLEGRRRKMGSHRKSRGQHYHEDPPDSKDHRALSFGDHPTATESQRQITGNATLTFDKCELRENCFNVVMVGSSNVGKTSFMKRIQSGSFSSDFSASIGIDMCIHAVLVDGREVMLQLWDTAGQERFHSISKQIFHKGQAFLLMYDITSFKSFSDVRYWISCIQESAGEDVIMLLLGNKKDCAARQVNPSEGQLLAKEYNIDFSECSAATGEHICSSVESLARMLTENHHKIEESIVVQKQKKRPRCC
ncbi:Ras-related protein Rab-44 [Merluccius polli]|uniref:Ras-related protein Rab-44 n=1 Tax=Merluccius polli TaxID=89951 RepID=A0AA47N9K5_MERPO|nr:Ras-related protein Rab-44 [Merluccius polli]